MRNTAYVKVKVKFTEDLTEEEIQDVLSNVNYSFDDGLISNTQIVEIE